MKHLVIGAGEVGTAIAAVLDEVPDYEVLLKDLEPLDIEADVLHICFPWSPEFETQVEEYEYAYGAKLVIVHSTVPVDTCDSNGWVHSPVRGRHPYLVPSLYAFTKHFGGDRAKEAAQLFAPVLVVKTHPWAVETEAGKLWELVQFGHQVLIQQQIHEWCQQNGIDFDTVYTDFAETYNEGYALLDELRFIRPVLDHMPGPIGGHCVRQCAKYLDHPLAKRVAESGDDGADS